MPSALAKASPPLTASPVVQSPPVLNSPRVFNSVIMHYPDGRRAPLLYRSVGFRHWLGWRRPSTASIVNKASLDVSAGLAGGVSQPALLVAA